MTKSILHSAYLEVEKLILDTHVLIWYTQGIELTKVQADLVEKVRAKSCLYVSAISFWEIAMLARKNRKNRIVVSMGLNAWIEQILSISGLNLIDLSIPILTQSCELLNYPHKDPTDRLIIASSRYINAHLMTFDQKIIDYAHDGYLKVVEG